MVRRLLVKYLYDFSTSIILSPNLQHSCLLRCPPFLKATNFAFLRFISMPKRKHWSCRIFSLLCRSTTVSETIAISSTDSQLWRISCAPGFSGMPYLPRTFRYWDNSVERSLIILDSSSNPLWSKWDNQRIVWRIVPHYI